MLSNFPTGSRPHAASKTQSAAATAGDASLPGTDLSFPSHCFGRSAPQLKVPELGAWSETESVETLAKPALALVGLMA
jgi:hypothetical protein